MIRATLSEENYRIFKEKSSSTKKKTSRFRSFPFLLNMASAIISELPIFTLTCSLDLVSFIRIIFPEEIRFRAVLGIKIGI